MKKRRIAPSERMNQELVSEADPLGEAALLPGARIFFDPLVDLDRTMDVSNGILDTLCNPRPAFHALCCRNTVLYGARRGQIRQSSKIASNAARGLQITVEEGKLMLLMPVDSDSECIRPAGAAASLLGSEDESLQPKRIRWL